MKIFSIKNVLGLVAIGGVVAYVRKHGGFKKAFQGLIAKKDEILGEKTETSTAQPETATTSPGTKPSTAYSAKSTL